MSENSCVSLSQENESIASFNSPKENQNSLKRNVDCSPEDDGVSLVKYKRLLTDEKLDSKSMIDVSNLPVDNDTASDSSNTENSYHDKENIPDNSNVSRVEKHANNDQNRDFQYRKDTAGASPNGYISPSKASAHVQIIQSSQFLTDNMNNIDSCNISIKQSNSQLNETEDNEEDMMETESLNLSTNKIVEQVNDQDLNMQNMIPADQYIGIPQSAGRSKNSIIERNHHNPINDQFIPSSMNQDHAYIEQNNLVRPIEANMQMQQIPSTSVQEINNGTNIASIDVTQLILGLRNDVKSLTHKLEEQENILSAVVAANQIYLEPLLAQSFPQRYNLRLPLSRLEDFQNFNTWVSNTKFANEFIMDLCTCIDNNTTLAKNILKMLRKYMSKELARLFTASQKTPNKLVLKDTMFCTCLLQALKISIRNGMLPLELEKSFFRNLSLVVTGAKGWHIRDDASDD